MELELDEYIITHKALPREQAFLAAIVGAYLIDHWAFLAGVGVEIEPNENLAIFRGGVEYAIRFNKGWRILPSFIVDWKEGFDTYSLALGVGKVF
jgi:hypothetical protein